MATSGIPATARILYVDMGSTEGDVRRGTGGLLPAGLSWWPPKIGLRVDCEGMAPYDIEIKQHIAWEVEASVQPGAAVEVRINPSDPSDVIIDFGRPIVPRGSN